MSTYPVIAFIDNQPTFEKPLGEILAEVKPCGAIKILSPIEYHTDQQRKWYKGVCVRGLSDWNGDTPSEWDLRLKMLCGDELLKTELIYFDEGKYVKRRTIRGVGKKNLTQYIENILSIAITNDWPVTPPDSELRR